MPLIHKTNPSATQAWRTRNNTKNILAMRWGSWRMTRRTVIWNTFKCNRYPCCQQPVSPNRNSSVLSSPCCCSVLVVMLTVNPSLTFELILIPLFLLCLSLPQCNEGVYFMREMWRQQATNNAWSNWCLLEDKATWKITSNKTLQVQKNEPAAWNVRRAQEFALPWRNDYNPLIIHYIKDGLPWDTALIMM